MGWWSKFSRAFETIGESIVSALVSIFSKPPVAPPPQIMEKAAPILKDDPKEIIKKARQSMGVDCIKYYNVGVCGQSGVGKSSFVNGFLCLDEDEACDVGEIETTQEIKCYSNNKWPFLKLWDIPGAGTKGHPSKTYFQDKKLYVFDAILLLSSDRFLEVDFDIMKSAREFGTPCVFVRTKCDIGVKNRARRDKVKAFEASQRLRIDVSRSFRAGLAQVGILDQMQLFFISSMFFCEPDVAYSIYNHRTNSWDTTLPSMDERNLVSFIVDTAQRRADRA